MINQGYRRRLGFGKLIMDFYFKKNSHFRRLFVEKKGGVETENQSVTLKKYRD